MLKIDTNGVIKYSRGDDVKFPLFLNQGTKTSPIRYSFSGPQLKIITFNNELKVTYDLTIWENIIQDIGNYTFTYNGTNWELNNEVVSLEDYGLYLNGNPNIDDTIDVIYIKDDGCEVYFYLFQPDDDKPFFKKTFTPKNDLWKGKLDTEEPTGDIKITLLGTDEILYPREHIKTLSDLTPGKYYYKIQAKLLDRELLTTGEISYVLNTVTNRLPIYIVDDNFDRLY